MKKLILTAVFGLLLFSSCDEYLGNTNSEQNNNPSTSSISPSQALAGAINNYQNYQSITLADYGNKMSYVWALNSGFTTNDAVYSHNYTSNDYISCFENGFIFADNFQDIINKKDTYPNYEYHFGIAKIFKVMTMDYITALYGDVPYSEAFNTNIEFPKYDDDKTIIPKLFVELDQARAFLSTANPNVVALGTEDIVFRGDTSEWIRLANTIELKLLLRLSKTTDPTLVTLRTERADIINANQDFITADVTVNPGYNKTALGQRNPIFRIHGLNEAFNAWTSTNRANASGDYFVKVLNGTMNNATLTTGVIDPRRARMITTTIGGIQGVFPTASVSRYSSFYFGRVGGDFNNNACIRDAYLMQVAEAYFLKAEAIERGYISGTAQAEFNNGIDASFNFYNRGWGDYAIPPMTTSSSVYIAATDSKNGLGWTGSADKKNCIITQKYLALAQWSGIELYLDNQRTGYPVIPLPMGVTQTVRANRLVYPSSEYSANSKNVPTVLNTDLFTVNSKTPYYLE